MIYWPDLNRRLISSKGRLFWRPLKAAEFFELSMGKIELAAMKSRSRKIK